MKKVLEGNGQNPPTELPAFKTFTGAVEKRCIELPVVTTITEVGSY